MSHQVATPPQLQRRAPRRFEWALIIAFCFSLLSLCILEPLARNSVQNHNSEFDLPQTKNDYQSSKALSSKVTNTTTNANGRVGSNEEGGELEAVVPPITQTNTRPEIADQEQELNHLNKPSTLGAVAAKCTFCEGKEMSDGDLIVPNTGGNTCSSIKAMAADKVDGSEICAIMQKEETVCCPEEPQSAKQQVKRIPSTRFENEMQVGISFKENLLQCETRLTQPLHSRCSSLGNITNTSTHLFIYNPSIRDKFLCNANIIIGPKSVKPVTHDDINKCGGGKVLMLEVAFRTHSFPKPPTMENRHEFPGILIENRRNIRLGQLLKSLQSNLSTTRITSEELEGNNLDDTFSSTRLSGALQERAFRPRKMYGYYLDDTFLPEEDRVLSDAKCDIKCAGEPAGGTVFQQYVYGTDWLFTFSIEGEQVYPIKVDENAWKRNEFYGTTSFKSEIPRIYREAIKLLTVGIPGDEFPPVNYSAAIKGASFIARNCRSRNNRETVVKQMIRTSFRVDSLSSCLHNAEPPEGVIMKGTSKIDIMQRYLFHLAFENQNTDDYITEKLWGALKSGTIPVYLGAPNIDEHFFPNNSFINVNDFSTTQELAQYLIKVANNETLYNSYHAWRNEPLPKSFLDKYLPVLGRNNCRLCRWAHARKYGLGWNHEQQVIKPVALSREACVDSAGLIRHPAVESWWEMVGEGLVSVEVKSRSPNESSFTTTCPLKEEVPMAKIEGGISRSVWSRDGATDILLQGQASKSLLLRLEFQMKQHKPLRHLDSHIAWIQNEVSRISLVMVDGNGQGATHLVSSAESGFVSIKVDPSSLPLRIRIIIEDYDRFHKGANQYQTYYGQIMTEDVLSPPILFALKEGESFNPTRTASMIRDTIEDNLTGLASEWR